MTRESRVRLLSSARSWHHRRMRGAALVVVVVVAWLAGPVGADTGPPPQLDLTPLAAKANADLLWPLAEPPDATPHLALMSWYGEAWPELCSAHSIQG